MKRPSRRSEKKIQKRKAIVAAAIDVFSRHGFAAARMEDVARRADVAKGTVYLYFANKEALFEGIIRETILPVVDDVRVLEPQPGEPMRAFAERLALRIAASLNDRRRRAVLHLLLAEGSRFPRCAEIYYHLVVEAGVGVARRLAERAREAGQLNGDALVRYPQLLQAPILVGLIWSSLFERFEHLDVRGMVRAQLDLLFQPVTRSLDT